MPKVSIIVPVYNVQEYLRRCIDSILKQTFTDYQLILVNDGSPDQCPAICDEYAASDKRIEVIHKKNGGLSSARLAGFQLAKGDYICFADSDDYLDECMIEKLYSSCVSEDADIALCGYYTANDNQAKAHKLPFDTNIIQKDEITSNFVLPIIGHIYSLGYINLPGFLWLRLFKKEILDKKCFVSEREFYTEDVIFNLLIAPKCQRIAIVNIPLYYYWQNLQSLTNKYRKNLWKLLLNRYYFYVDYCQQNKLSEKAKDRLDFNLFGSISFGIENACRITNDKNLSLAEIKSILDHSETTRLFKRIKSNLMTQGQKLFYFMCKYKMYQVLYHYKKLRMSR
ncbi:glycosyltransferase family 2 protein [Sporomusa malonica]|uniref:Glycosyltransferase involved in cell wall bisynthesis n=1 Tax=Sporomusa malonica TaxID=112901 RepID=A0A1W2DM34_9FIRM|nr:glycosyltransferase family 2 protein [Sporomusa malonica]SMC98076.1 Glycosyltransferase involved in cell wall bisynthesis [Sporomusa malonica]